jgi:hypothetical protein
VGLGHAAFPVARPQPDSYPRHLDDRGHLQHDEALAGAPNHAEALTGPAANAAARGGVDAGSALPIADRLRAD